jgi:hypothetical protein
LIGRSTIIPPGDYFLQHFELITTIPALVAGYIMARYFPKLATCAWLFPTTILAYKLLTFTDPYVSVLFASSSNRFAYFFTIQPNMPTLALDFGGVDVERVAQQAFVVGPFYSGLAYSLGAFAEKYQIAEKFFTHHSTTGPEELQP